MTRQRVTRLTSHFYHFEFLKDDTMLKIEICPDVPEAVLIFEASKGEEKKFGSVCIQRRYLKELADWLQVIIKDYETLPLYDDQEED